MDGNPHEKDEEGEDEGSLMAIDQRVLIGGRSGGYLHTFDIYFLTDVVCCCLLRTKGAR